MPADAPARCELVVAGADGGELSLAENVVRVAMHPADQCSKRSVTSWSVASIRLPWHGGSRGTPRSSGSR